MPNYTTFKGATDFGRAKVTEQLSDNLISFLNNGFLSIGAFYNITHPASGNFQNNLSTLRPVTHTSMCSIWEGFRKNWIWEQSVEYAVQPIPPLAYLNGSPFSSGSYSVNYNLGQIVLATGIPVGSKVEADFSYRYISVDSADTEVFKQIQKNSYRTDNNFMVGSGSWNIDAINRVQLPAVYVEVVPNREDVPKQIGGGVFINQDVIFHVVAENTSDRKRIMDILADEKEHTIYLYDKNAVGASGDFPLDVNGFLINNNQYSYLVENYPWKSLYFVDTHTQFISDCIPGLYMGDVRASVEIDYGLGV